MSTTTSTDALRVDFLPVDILRTRGRFGITAMPGRIGKGFTGTFKRDLPLDVAELKNRHSVDTIVSFMLLEEYAGNGPDLSQSRDAFRRHGIGFEHFPFKEGTAPAESDAGRFVALVQNWLSRLIAGETIVIHSRAGHGRCGLVAACLLVAQGMEADEAIQVVLNTRERGIQGLEQEHYVHAFKALWFAQTHAMHKLVRNTLDESGISYSAAPGEIDNINFNMATETGVYAIRIMTNERGKLISSFVTAPIKVPQERRPAMAEFITRANYGLILGTFELDLNDGELRIRTGTTIEGGQLSVEMIRSMVQAPIYFMDKYLPGALTVAFGDADPHEVIRQIEA